MVGNECIRGRSGGFFYTKSLNTTDDLHVLCVLCLHAGVVEALQSSRWWAWCLSMDGKGRKWWAMCVDDGGYWKVVGLGFGQDSHLQNLPIFFLGKWSDFVPIT